jgi:hypothetical protein
MMFGMKTQDLPECSDIAVDAAAYLVEIEILGDTPECIFYETISAGSAAHAAVMAGVVLLERVSKYVKTTRDMVAFSHNVRDHTRVTVTRR